MNSLSGNTLSSDTFTGNYSNKQIVATLKPYIDAAQKPVAGTERVVGVVVVINGRIETVDIFESTPLFKKLWPKLLKSYALDASISAKTKPAKTACNIGDVRNFLRGAMDAKIVKNEKNAGGLRVTKRATKEFVSFSATDSDASTKDEAQFAESIHAAAFSKPTDESSSLGN